MIEIGNAAWKAKNSRFLAMSLADAIFTQSLVSCGTRVSRRRLAREFPQLKAGDKRFITLMDNFGPVSWKRSISKDNMNRCLRQKSLFNGAWSVREEAWPETSRQGCRWWWIKLENICFLSISRSIDLLLALLSMIKKPKFQTWKLQTLMLLSLPPDVHSLNSSFM